MLFMPHAAAMVAARINGIKIKAELGFVEPELGLDFDPDDGKHRPHHEIDREGQRVHGEDGVLFPFFEFDDRVRHCSKPSGYLASEARGERAALCRRAQW
jgi:hypothetical protein